LYSLFTARMEREGQSSANDRGLCNEKP